jgi:hypothetical protein
LFLQLADFPDPFRTKHVMIDKPNARPDDPNVARQNRLREALRENLKRRKSQARGRNDRAPGVLPQDSCDANPASPDSPPQVERDEPT